MVDWAELHELAANEKASHAEVKYVKLSYKKGERCGNCRNFIKDAAGENRCRSVECPINILGWCQRYQRN